MTASQIVRTAFAALPLLALSLSAPAFAVPASGAANLSFSGGNGNAVTLTLAGPLTYTVTTAGTYAPDFLFANVGNLYGSTAGTSVSGTITYSINGGAAQAINGLSNGTASGNRAATDLAIYKIKTSSALNVGDKITLSAGTLTGGSIAGSVPSGGTYNTYLVDSNGSRISSDAVAATVAAPEPGTIALLLTAGIPVVGIARRRKRSDIGK